MEIKIIEETCCVCGIVFWIGERFRDRLVSDKKAFFCPNGHSQSYTGESYQAKILRLQSEKNEAVRMQNQKDVEIEILKKQLKRKCKTKK